MESFANTTNLANCARGVAPLSSRLSIALDTAEGIRSTLGHIHGRAFGYPPSTPVGTSKLEVVSPDSIEAVLDKLISALGDVSLGVEELNGRI